MIINITEEEREFLERVCKRAELLCYMKKQLEFLKDIRGEDSTYLNFENDSSCISNLTKKLIQLDTNLINKVVKDDS